MSADHRHEPIITSLLDTDFYQLTMGQWVFHKYPNIPVVDGFINRTTKVRLAEHVDLSDLNRELTAVQSLQLQRDEHDYLASLKNNGQPLFSREYLTWFSKLRLPSFTLGMKDGQIGLTFPGTWAETMYWETLALAIISELYFRSILKQLTHLEQIAVFDEGHRRLMVKLQRLGNYPDLRFMEFGTRRRFSNNWQRHVVNTTLKYARRNIAGTSNVALAKEFGLDPRGTMAHKIFMVMATMDPYTDDSIRASHNRALREWWDFYGYDLSVALTDTFGSSFFFKDFTPEQAAQWKGLRQDSGQPKEFRDITVQFYRNLGIDPTSKVFVPSDGLDLDKMIELHQPINPEIQQMPGCGTNWTNDLGIPTISQVIKTISANGRPTVKLSDNLAKAMGPPAEVERYKRIFGHTVSNYVECKV